MTQSNVAQFQTVTGLIPVNDITLADAHAHLWIHPPKGVSPKARLLLDNPHHIETELRDFRSAGGNLLVDCQPGGCGHGTKPGILPLPPGCCFSIIWEK